MRTLKKKPIQIYIEPKQELMLERLASEKSTSKAAIIRLSIDRYLAELPPEEDPAIGIIGLGRSGKGDMSANHDNYVAKHVSTHEKEKRR
jgi:hypothetical protein